jgi:hypothetical protein
MAKSVLARRRLTTLGVALVVLALALATRARALGSFSWPDELTWLERSAAFVTALERGDLAGTYLSDHPGVLPMWGFGGALYLRAGLTGDRSALDGLAAEEYEDDVPTQLATAALFTVACTSLAIVAAYLLLIPLLGRAGAALGGLLLALDPFYLSHSRIVHVDALLSSFMLLSVLSLLVYLRQPGRRRYLVLSGVSAGLALLTKTPALFLIPLTTLALGGQWLWRRLGRDTWGRPGQLAGALGLWLAIAWGIFVVLWPAAWLDPLFFFYRLYRASRWGVIVSHGSNFFLGQVVADPGPLFYAVVLPFRLAPAVLVLLPASLILLPIAWKRRKDVRLPALCLAFVLFFTVMVSLAAKKGDRYLLPVYPVADVLAAWALLALVRGVAAASRARGRGWRIGYGAALALVLGPSVLWLGLAPHYGAYFNPLVGGGPAASRTFAFGQGEGLDLAAGYLNDKENSAELLVISFYPQQFRYYFDGEVTSLRWGDWNKTWLFAEYVVFYVSQVQRQLPTAELVDLFSAQEPEHVVRLGGVDFARIYRPPLLLSGQPPGVEETLDDGRLGDELALVGYALSADRASPGEELDATLYWQAVGRLDRDLEFGVQLVGQDGQIAWQQTGLPFEGRFPTSWWRPGRTMYDRYRMALPEDVAPGQYELVVSAWGSGSGPPVQGEPPGSLVVGDISVENAP